MIPNLVFTLPRIAQAGVTVEEAKAAPDQYKVVQIPYGRQNEWINNHEEDTDLYKMIFAFPTQTYMLVSLLTQHLKQF